jgi:hypothetical protein
MMNEYRKTHTSADLSNVFRKFQNSRPSFACKNAAQRSTLTAILQAHRQSGVRMGKVVAEARALCKEAEELQRQVLGRKSAESGDTQTAAVRLKGKMLSTK